MGKIFQLFHKIKIHKCSFRTRIQALHSQAPDAYLFPADNSKNHGLNGDGKFIVVFEY